MVVPLLAAAIAVTMICCRCQKAVRKCEGVKCVKCESGYHLQCVSGRTNMEMGSGDKELLWVCGICQNPAATGGAKVDGADVKHLLKAINAVSEKVELVNKIQLPKINNDLLQIKSVTDRIAKQNEEILLKIDELDRKRASNQGHYRRRNVNTSPRGTLEDQAPILGTEKITRYRTRRRSYPLLKILLQFNRALRTTRTLRRFRN